MIENIGALKKCSMATIFLSAGLLISGCSDEEQTKHNESTNSAEVVSDAKPKVKPAEPVLPSLEEQGVTVLSQPKEPAKDSDYYKISRGMDLLYLFGANSPSGVDVRASIDNIYTVYGEQSNDQLTQLLGKYQNGDQFVKNDVSKQIEPILKENISKLSGTKYVVADVQGPLSLGEYDFDRQGFTLHNGLKDPAEGDSSVPYERPALSFNDVIRYKLSFINSSDLNFIKVPEELARKINEYMKQGGVNFRFYGYLQSVAEDKASNQRYVVVKIQKVELTTSIYSDGPQEVLTSFSL